MIAKPRNSAKDFIAIHDACTLQSRQHRGAYVAVVKLVLYILSRRLESWYCSLTEIAETIYQP